MKNLEGKLAVITGASGGLGTGFAEALANRKCNLVLVARSQDKLTYLQQKLSQNTGVTVNVVPIDLAGKEAPLQLYRFVKERSVPVDFLVNNAGLGLVGPFLETGWEEDEAMLDLNVRALHHLTKFFLWDMVDQGYGRILNVASIAGFQPMPYFAAYAATKAHVLSLSEALNIELAKTNVRVSALCPGPARTAFWKKAGSRENRILDLMMMENRKVVEYGVELMLSDRASGIPGLFNKLMVFSNRLIPRRLSALISAMAMKESVKVTG